MSVIDRFLQATDELKVGILSNEDDIQLIVSAITEVVEAKDETQKILHLVVLEENAKYLLAEPTRLKPRFENFWE